MFGFFLISVSAIVPKRQSSEILADAYDHLKGSIYVLQHFLRTRFVETIESGLKFYIHIIKVIAINVCKAFSMILDFVTNGISRLYTKCMSYVIRFQDYIHSKHIKIEDSQEDVVHVDEIEVKPMTQEEDSVKDDTQISEPTFSEYKEDTPSSEFEALPSESSYEEFVAVEEPTAILEEEIQNDAL